MLQIFLDFAKQEHLGQGVAEHHNNEYGRGDNKRPNLALDKHDQVYSDEEPSEVESTDADLDEKSM